jgi:hypothetical protein
MTEFVSSFMEKQSNCVVFIQKLNYGVYCIDIQGNEFIFQTYEGMSECVFELLENGFHPISNTSPVVEKMLEQYERQLFNVDKKAIERIQFWFEKE